MPTNRHCGSTSCARAWKRSDSSGALPRRTRRRRSSRGTSMRVLDGDPGVECQIDFAQMGFITDTDTGRRRKVHALIFTAVLSRHMFVHLTYSQTLTEVIAGCEAAWAILRRRLQGPDPGQPETSGDRRGPGEPAPVDRLAGLRPARRFRDGSGESPVPTRQTARRAGRAVRPREFLRRRDLRQPGGRAGAGRDRWCTTHGGDADPRHHQRPPTGSVQRAGSRCAAAGPTGLRRADLAVGQGSPGLPHRDRQGPLLRSLATTSGTSSTPGRTRSWSNCSTAAN